MNHLVKTMKQFEAVVTLYADYYVCIHNILRLKHDLAVFLQ